MPTFRPRWAASLTIPAIGTRAARRAQEADTSSVILPINPIKVTLDHSDHNHANRLLLTAPLKDAGFDVRLLGDAVVTFAMANADDRGDWDPGDTKNVRFIGTLVRSSRVLPEDGERVLELEFHDFTSLMLTQKIGSAAVPNYSMTLDAAWRLLCDHCGWLDEESGEFFSCMSKLRDRLVLRGLDRFPVLGDKVAKRFNGTKIPLKPETDFWAAWQACCEPLISYIDRDQVIISTVEAYYASNARVPRLIFGENIVSLTESRNPVRRKGITLKAFDPASGRTIEADYPPIGDPSLRRKRVGSKKSAERVHEREAFNFPGITNPALLLAAAKRVYEERSRQELEGRLETVAMSVEAVNGADFDLLTLRSGDNIRVELAQEDKAFLASALSEGQSEQQMADYLVRRGYEPAVAQLMAQNASQLSLLNPIFYVKTVTTEIDVEGLTYKTTVGYCSRLLVSGDADVSRS